MKPAPAASPAAPKAFDVTFYVPTGAHVACVVREGAPVLVGSAAPATVILDARDPEIQPVHMRLAITDRGLEAFSEAPSRFSIGDQKRLRSPIADGDLMKIGATTMRIGVKAISTPPPSTPPPLASPPPPAAPSPVAAPAALPAANQIAASLAAAVQSRLTLPAVPASAAPTLPSDAAPAMAPSPVRQPAITPALTPAPVAAPTPMRQPAPPSVPARTTVISQARSPGSTPASAPADPWSDQVLMLFSAPTSTAGSGGARKWKVGKGKAGRKKEADGGADPLSRIVSARSKAAATAREAEAGAATQDGKRHLLTPSAVRHALEGAPALLAAVPGRDLMSLLLYIESCRSTGTLEALGHDGDRLVEGRLPFRDGSLALPLVGDPLAPVLGWLVPLLLLERVEARFTYSPPAPTAAEAAIQVGALLEELDRRAT